LEGSHERQFNPKIFATGTERCPVQYFKIFESHRPEEAKTPTSPFFLAINHNAWRSKSTWYKVSPLGKNQIGQFLPKAAKKAGLQACGRKISNHLVRKTSISRLPDAGILENFVTHAVERSQEFTKCKLIQVSLSRSTATNVGYASTASSSCKFKRSRTSFFCQQKQKFVAVFNFQPEQFQRSSDAAPFILRVGNHRINFKLLFNRVIQLAALKKTKQSEQNWLPTVRKTFSVVFPPHL